MKPAVVAVALFAVGLSPALANASTTSAPPDSTPPATAGSTPGSLAPAVLPDPPGELFDVNGHEMHLYCTGAGHPTVVLDAGLGDSSVNFQPLQASIAEFTRVCSYDRAGYGWSEPGPEPRTSEQIVDELVSLLDTAQEAGPYVLVGHSFGGFNMILFGATHPDDVAGVVLIDSSHPEQTAALSEVPALLALQDDDIASLGDLATASAAGDVVAADVLANAPEALADDLKQIWAEVFIQPDSLNASVTEYASFETSAAEVADIGSLGDTPLVVLAHGLALSSSVPTDALDQLGLTVDMLDRYDTIWRGLQEDHLTRSTNSQLIVAEHSTHYIYFDEPQLVMSAVHELVDGAR